MGQRASWATARTATRGAVALGVVLMQPCAPALAGTVPSGDDPLGQVTDTVAGKGDAVTGTLGSAPVIGPAVSPVVGQTARTATRTASGLDGAAAGLVDSASKTGGHDLGQLPAAGGGTGRRASSAPAPAETRPHRSRAAPAPGRAPARGRAPRTAPPAQPSLIPPAPATTDRPGIPQTAGPSPHAPPAPAVPASEPTAAAGAAGAQPLDLLAVLATAALAGYAAALRRSRAPPGITPPVSYPPVRPRPG